MPESIIQLLERLILPVGLVWWVMGLAFLWSSWKRRWRWACLTGGVFLLLGASGNEWLSARLLATLEQPYAGIKINDIPSADAVVMLGGVLEQSKQDPLGIDLAATADRVTTAMELMRLGKAQALVLGGGGYEKDGHTVSESHMLKAWIEHWGLFSAPIFALGKSANTRDEATHTRALMRREGWKNILLVTSAGHMRRALALFHKLGIAARPVACDFEGLANLQGKPSIRIVPTADALRRTDAYLHERLGWFYYKWRGWV